MVIFFWAATFLGYGVFVNLWDYRVLLIRGKILTSKRLSRWYTKPNHEASLTKFYWASSQACRPNIQCLFPNSAACAAGDAHSSGHLISLFVSEARVLPRVFRDMFSPLTQRFIFVILVFFHFGCDKNRLTDQSWSWANIIHTAISVIIILALRSTKSGWLNEILFLCYLHRIIAYI